MNCSICLTVLFLDLRLFPEEKVGSDRVVEQLLYEPPLNESQELKKILLWNGLGSWTNVEGGRKEFVREQCPVSRKLTECLD